MAIQSGKRNSDWLKAISYLFGAALLMTFLPIQAETGRTPVWIQDPYTGESVLTSFGEPDTSLWNGQRITDYEESLKADMAPPLGILTIEKLNINVPIYNGTSDLILDRGAGRIKGTAKMDDDGNLGISSHRDGYFRRMKDIQVGDEIEVQTTRGVQSYAVSSITILDKSDISPLASSTEKILTIVTCYPFYHVGHAPKRYIVKATAKKSEIDPIVSDS